MAARLRWDRESKVGMWGGWGKSADLIRGHLDEKSVAAQRGGGRKERGRAVDG